MKNKKVYFFLVLILFFTSGVIFAEDVVPQGLEGLPKELQEKILAQEQMNQDLELPEGAAQQKSPLRRYAPRRRAPVRERAQRVPQQASQQTTRQAIQEGPQDKISLDIKGMDIIDVLKLLSKQAGLNIIAGKNVKGRVTLFLKDVDPWDAFEIILAANNLAYEKRGNIITVMADRDYELLYGQKFNIRQKVKIVKLLYAKATEVSKALNQVKTKVGVVIVDEGSNSLIIRDTPHAMKQMVNAVKELDIPTQTKVYSLNYATAETVKEKLTNTLSKLGAVEIDERTNKLVVTDIPSKMQELNNLVAEFDEKTKQVLIEAKIVQIDLDDEYKLGVNWDAFFNGVNLTLGSNFKAITGTISPTTSNSATGGVFKIGDLDSDNYQGTIKALETLGKTNILSSPRIVSSNNEEAKILVGTNQPYATSTTSQSGDNQVTSYSITYLDLGVKLYVTPTINNDDFITMKIKPEVSSQTSEYEYGEYDDTVPIVKTSQAETTVVVKDGTTIVIAGLMESRDEEEVSKVPVLGDIPLLGELFKSRSRGSTANAEKSELVIFITPRIITGDIASEENAYYEDFIQKSTDSLRKREFFRIENKDDEEKSASFAKQRKSVIPESRNINGAELASNDNEAKPHIGVLAPRDSLTQIVPEEKTPEEPVKNYKETVRDKVKEYINTYSITSLSGEVYVEFSVLKDGTLKQEPKILKSTNEDLKETVVACIKNASPFPPFPPESVSDREKTFKILISYQ